MSLIVRCSESLTWKSRGCYPGSYKWVVSCTRANCFLAFGQATAEASSSNAQNESKLSPEAREELRKAAEEELAKAAEEQEAILQKLFEEGQQNVDFDHPKSLTPSSCDSRPAQ